MRLPLITRLVQLTLIFGALSSLNCQRITMLPPVSELHYPPLIPLSPHDYPSFSDNGDREALCRALNYQLIYLARLKQPAEYAFGNTTVSSEKVRLTLVTFLSILKKIRYNKAPCNLDLVTCEPTAKVKEKLEKLRMVRMYLDAAKAKVEFCHEPQKGMTLYNYALKLMNKIECRNC